VKLLIVDDDPLIRNSLETHLKKEHAVFLAENSKIALSTLDKHHIDLALIDVKLGGESGIDLLKEIKSRDLSISCAILSGIDEDATIEKALNWGALDYLIKPASKTQLHILIKKISTQRTLALKGMRLGKRKEGPLLTSKNAKINQIYHSISKLKGKTVPILIQGETGTGKEILARLIWEQEGDSNRPFIAVHCASIPENLIESELFGYEKGAFTGAHAGKAGLIELADGGDLFLDEIATLSPMIQIKLLRVLQEKTVQRLGSTRPRPIQFRILSATNEPLEALTQKQGFREDLLHRIRGVQFSLPTLHERSEDLEAFIFHFLEEYSTEPLKVDPDVLIALKSHTWPGNLRELEQAIRAALVFSEGGRISLNDLPEWLVQKISTPQLEKSFVETPEFNEVKRVGLPSYLEQVEERLIAKALEVSKSVSEAATLLQLPRGTIDYKLKKYKLL